MDPPLWRDSVLWVCSSGDRAMVSGAVCRRFESFQARSFFLLKISGRPACSAYLPFVSTVCERVDEEAVKSLQTLVESHAYLLLLIIDAPVPPSSLSFS